MLLNAYLYGLGFSLAVLMIQDYADRRVSWRDARHCLIGAVIWPIAIPTLIVVTIAILIMGKPAVEAKMKDMGWLP